MFAGATNSGMGARDGMLGTLRIILDERLDERPHELEGAEVAPTRAGAAPLGRMCPWSSIVAWSSSNEAVYGVLGPPKRWSSDCSVVTVCVRDGWDGERCRSCWRE